jgi:hypothetical protein
LKTILTIVPAVQSVARIIIASATVKLLKAWRLTIIHTGTRKPGSLPAWKEAIKMIIIAGSHYKELLQDLERAEEGSDREYLILDRLQEIDSGWLCAECGLPTNEEGASSYTNWMSCDCGEVD